MQHSDDYNDLHVKSDTLLLDNALEKFRNKYLEICELDPAQHLLAPRLM